MNLLDQLFGTGSRAVRREALFQQKSDGKGNAVMEAVEGSSVTLSPDGSIDSARVVGFFHCGHVTTDGIGGKCGEPGCLNISCKACFTASRCAGCAKPLCLEHLNHLVTETAAVPFCPRCHAAVSRRCRWRNVARAVLSPFMSLKPPAKR